MRAPLMLALLLCAAGAGCDARPIDPTTGMVLLYADVDARRSSTATAALEAPLPRQADDPHSFTALMARAQEEAGADATRVAVRDLSILLGDRDWTTGLDELFAGDVEVSFQPTAGGPSHPVATIPWEKVRRSGAALVVNDATFDSDALAEADRAAIVAGDFAVTVTGRAGPAFAGRREALQLAVAMVFEIYP